MFNNVDDGRNRSSEIASLIDTIDLEFLYGEDNGGIGYCAFKYLRSGQYVASTVRTSSTEYIQIDFKLMKGNQSRCQEHEVDHNLILAFNWNDNRSVYLIENDKILHNVSSMTKGRNSLVFRKSLLDLKEEYLSDEVIKLL